MSKTNEHLLIIRPGGSIKFIYSDDLLFLSPLGTVSTKRVSFVEPKSRGKSTVWYAYMGSVGGPALGPFMSRGRALTEEKNWLVENYLMGERKCAY